ncbi:hypothetical protein PLICRDRAFT_515536 [Plicaturopsis crispa FD-325 SS-3]|nr:hypothetical protein PLICRDRAFT_515536 [Plicaturopsis crispa FD-325 SS-3]
MLSSTTPRSRTTSILQNHTAPSDLFSDSRTHGYPGPIRNVRLPRVTSPGGGAVSRSEDESRCVVAGKESLRILRMSDTSHGTTPEHKSAVGRGGHRIDASRNMWESSGLKIDSANTDVAWCRGLYSNKILTSSRNGDLVTWDLNKSGATKFERKTRDHLRSIHKLSCSTIVHNYCVTGSADGDVRVWDLRDMTRSIMKIHHPTSVRNVVFSPNQSQPLQAIAGLDNGSIYRWDLKMGQRGQLDRLPMAHSGAVLALDWCSGRGEGGTGWLVSGGLDHTAKIWDLTSSGLTHMPHRPTYILHPSFPIRRVLWRPSYETELAIVSNAEFGTGSNPDLAATESGKDGKPGSGDRIEIWDVRREWVAKWAVSESASGGGVTDLAWGDSHALWAQHSSGCFSQLDLRNSVKPLDSIPRAAAAWEASGSLAFVADKTPQWEVPFDDLIPERKHEAQERRIKLKKLGDPPSVPASQSMGFFVDDSEDDLDMFVKLAKTYVFQGHERTTICDINANAAFEAGNDQAARTWLLLGSLLTDLVPPPSPPISLVEPKPMRPGAAPHMARSVSAPKADPTVHLFLPPNRSSSVDVPRPTIQSHSVNNSPAVDRSSKRLPSGTVDPGSHSPAARPNTPSSPYAHQYASTGSLRLPLSSANSSTSNSPRGASGSLPPSAATSPHRLHSALPSTSYTHHPLSGNANTELERRKSMASQSRPLIRRESTALAQRLRRQSITIVNTPVPHSHSIGHGESPRPDSLRSRTSSRQYGEGVLDDSDSSGSSESEHGEVETGLLSEERSDEETSGLKPLISPHLVPRLALANPSPLSRVYGGGVAEEEDDESSPSPVSTDTESSSDSFGSEEQHRHIAASSQSSPATSKRGKGKRRRKAHTRSRSSTVASLAASAVDFLQVHRPLEKQHSTGSIRTVTAGDVISLHDGDPSASAGLRREETVTLSSLDLGDTELTNLRRGSVDTTASFASPSQKKQRSQAFSWADSRQAQQDPFVDYGPDEERWHSGTRDGLNPTESRSMDYTQRRNRVVRAEEAKFREMGWRTMRDTLDYLAEEGDVQMCAFLSLVASQELQVGKMKVVRFLDAYIDSLCRLRMHTSAAYLRKYVQVDQIRASTTLETTIYSSCGRCRKPIIQPAFSARTADGGVPRGGYSYCISCHNYATQCSICHLPVRAMLFQCSICEHGGHQECYRKYYMDRPMLEMPLRQAPSSLADFTTSQPSPSLQSKIRGRSRSESRDISDIESGTDRDDESVSGTTDVATEYDGGAVGVSGHKRLLGHLCAAGCGHFCWAANANADA